MSSHGPCQAGPPRSDTFEVATRRMSVKDATKELCITSSRVSHRIRALEESRGVKLFDRLARSPEPTREGQAHAPLVRAAALSMDPCRTALRRAHVRTGDVRVEAGRLRVRRRAVGCSALPGGGSIAPCRSK